MVYVLIESDDVVSFRCGSAMFPYGVLKIHELQGCFWDLLFVGVVNGSYESL